MADSYEESASSVHSQTHSGRIRICCGTRLGGIEPLQTLSGIEPLQTLGGIEPLQTLGGIEPLQTHVTIQEIQGE